MAGETINVTLGGTVYKVPHLTLGQLQRFIRLSDAFIKRPDKDDVALFDHNFEVSRLVLERADPPIPELAALECRFADLRAATDAILEFSGLKVFTSGEAESKGEA